MGGLKGGRRGDWGRNQASLGPTAGIWVQGCALSQSNEVSQNSVPWPVAITGESGRGGQKGDREKAFAPQSPKFHEVVKLNPLQTQPLQVGFQVAGGL